MTTKTEVLSMIERALIRDEENDLIGCAVIGDGVNLQFAGERTWWRIEVRDVTAVIDEAFRK